MKRIGLIAVREYRAIVRTRAFLFTLIGMPLLIAAVFGATTITRSQDGEAYSILDLTGRYAPAIDRRIETDHQRFVLTRLATYAEGKPVPTDRLWSQRRWYGEADVAAFLAAGGAQAAAAEIDRAAPPAEGDEGFRVPRRRFVKVDPPALANPDAASFQAAMAAGLKDDIPTSEGPRPLSVALFIPADYGAPGVAAQVWTNGRASAELVNLIQGELSRALRLEALAAAGIAPDAARAIETRTARVVVNRGQATRARIVMRSAAPMAMSYLLLLTLLITGSMMLQGLIEERSNKLLEAILACVTPDELMRGKLFGICAVGVTIIGVWVAFALVGAGAAPPQAAAMLDDAFAAFRSPLLVAAMFYYYLVGYVMISMFFLVVGALSESMQDAQAYLSPLIILLTVPFSIMVPSIMQGGDGPIAIVMSWIPIYTPFAMLARLGTGVGLGEILGTGALLAAFTALQFVFLGRIFRASLLRTGQPKFRGVMKLMRRGAVD